MDADRSRPGLLLSALGAMLLAVSVFLPWYGVSFTPGGIALAQHVGDQIVSQYGNASLQAYLAPFHAGLSSLAGQQFIAVSAHQVLHDLNVILLILAALAMLDALLALVRTDGVPGGAGASLVLLGAVAGACVLYRIVSPPDPSGGLLAFSVREGAWLALIGSLMVLAGGLWPRVRRPAQRTGAVEGALSGLSGWTPQG